MVVTGQLRCQPVEIQAYYLVIKLGFYYYYYPVVTLLKTMVRKQLLVWMNCFRIHIGIEPYVEVL